MRINYNSTKRCDFNKDFIKSYFDFLTVIYVMRCAAMVSVQGSGHIKNTRCTEQTDLGLIYLLGKTQPSIRLHFMLYMYMHSGFAIAICVLRSAFAFCVLRLYALHIYIYKSSLLKYYV